MDYKFVGDLNEEFTCQVCMKLLNEPQLTDCCGQHFCRACLDHWFQEIDKKQCPHCRSETFTHILNKPLKRKINELKVYCSHLSKGCGLTMKLEELERHLSIENSTGCGFVNIDCKNKCGQSIPRKDLTDHYDNNCTERTISCKYCNEAGPYSYITNEQDGGHIQECQEYPVDCPRKCGTVRNLKRKNLKAHKEVCPLEPVECPFREAGCEQELVRKDLEGHIESSTQQHLLKVMLAHNSLKVAHESLVKENMELKKSDHKLRLAVACVASEVGNIKTQQPAEANNGQLATSLENIEMKLNEVAIFLMNVGDKLVFKFLCDSLEWESPNCHVLGDAIQLSLKLKENNRLSIRVVEGSERIATDCSYDIRVEVECNERTTKPFLATAKQCKSETHELSLTNSVTLPINDSMPMPTDFRGGFYKTCVVTLSLQPKKKRWYHFLFQWQNMQARNDNG